MSDPRVHSLRCALAGALLLLLTGCTVQIVRPDPLLAVRDGEAVWIHYAPTAVVHDEYAFWDLHNIKNNVVGLTEFEVVRTADMLLDTLIPGPERRPVENGIEWVKNEYARLPPCAPVNIVGGLFQAIGPEKLCYGRQEEFFPRFVYLSDWVQETLGECNRVAGYAAPWGDRFIPPRIADPGNRAVDWAQNGLIGAYLYVVQFISVAVDRGIDHVEAGVGAAISATLRPPAD